MPTTTTWNIKAGFAGQIAMDAVSVPCHTICRGTASSSCRTECIIREINVIMYSLIQVKTSDPLPIPRNVPYPALQSVPIYQRVHLSHHVIPSPVPSGPLLRTIFRSPLCSSSVGATARPCGPDGGDAGPRATTDGNGV